MNDSRSTRSIKLIMKILVVYMIPPLSRGDVAYYFLDLSREMSDITTSLQFFYTWRYKLLFIYLYKI